MSIGGEECSSKMAASDETGRFGERRREGGTPVGPAMEPGVDRQTARLRGVPDLHPLTTIIIRLS